MKRPNFAQALPWPLIGSIIISLVLIIIYFGDTLFSLNAVSFGANGDGIKSYFAADYYVSYDESFLMSNGLNYPYGEHVLFTDNFFPVFFLIKLFAPICDLSPYTNGIINSIMLLSLVAATYFLFKTLRLLSIQSWVSCLAAPANAFMSPQVMRFAGHYSLSLVFYIPLLIYVLILFGREKKLKYAIQAGIAILLCSLCHMYYLMMAGVLVGGFLFYLIVFGDLKLHWKKSLYFFGISVAVPFVMIFLFMLLTDPVSDRSAYPYGFLVYKNAWEGIFLFDSQSSCELVNRFLEPDVIEWESRSFIGHSAVAGYFLLYGLVAGIPFLFHKSVTAFIIASVIGVLLYLLFKRRRKIWKLTGQSEIDALLWTGYAAMLVSMAFPVNVFPDLYNHIGVFREIRGIGRMAWIFFFVVNIAMLWFVQKRVLKKWLQIALFSVIILVMSFDLHRLCSANLSKITQNESLQSLEKLVVGSPLSDESFCGQYQAILTVPAYLVGSENTTVWNQDEQILMFSLFASRTSGLPILSSFLARTSISQSTDKASFVFGPSNHEPRFFNELNDGRDFLLISGPANRELYQGELLLLNHSTPVWAGQGFALSRISVDTVKSLYRPGPRDTSGLSFEQPILVNHFTDQPGDGYGTKGHIGPFALSHPNLVLSDSLVMPSEFSSEADISFWFSDIYEDGLVRAYAELSFYDAQGNMVLYDLTSLVKTVCKIDGHWAMSKRRLVIPANAVLFNLAIVHYELSINSIMIDDVMISKAGSHVFESRQGVQMIDNQYFFLQK